MAEDMTYPAKPTAFCMVVTPMHKDGSLDEEGFKAHLQRMIDGGVGIYIGSGGTGQGHALTPDELGRIYEVGAKYCKGKIPVYCNPPESRTAKEMEWKMRLGVKGGVDVVQIYQLDAGHGRTPTVGEQEMYFRTLLEAVNHPTILSIHQASGYLAPVGLTAKLVNEYKHVVGVNFHGPSLSYMLQLREMTRPNLRFYGGSVNLLSVLALGGWGCQAAEPNLVPKLFGSIITHFQAGRVKEMGAAYEKVLNLWSALAPAQAESQDATKNVLRGLGLPGGWTRPPRLNVKEETVQKVVAALEKMGIREADETTRVKK